MIRLPTNGLIIEEHTFESLIEGREEEFPNLARAARKIVPSSAVKIEWLVDKIVDGYSNLERWFNYQQITRMPYTKAAEQGSARNVADADDTVEEALTKFLRSVDTTIELGIPSRTTNNTHMFLTTAGGWRFYLGRDLTDEDELILRPLQIPMLRTYTVDYIDGSFEALDSPKYEWLCETSLQVNPA